MQSAPGSVELTDPAGDVVPLQTSSNRTYPGFDVVKLVVASDGKQITLAATLASPPGDFASDVVEFYVDTDNSNKSGAALLNPEIGGFEFKVLLESCIRYSDSTRTCAGGPATAAGTPASRAAGVRVDRYKGESEIDGRTPVADSSGFAAVTTAQTPIVGSVILATLDYAVLKVTPRQTIRIVARESSAGTSTTGELLGFFPAVLLPLK